MGYAIEETEDSMGGVVIFGIVLFDILQVAVYILLQLAVRDGCDPTTTTPADAVRRQ